jgi:hypothetical protein
MSLYAIHTSRRNIAAIRQDLGIPKAAIRKQAFWYPFRSFFSGIYNMDLTEILAKVPAVAGVYEIRLRTLEIDYPKAKSSVIYLGRSQYLKKRLSCHLQQAASY